jgi:hypothetical protein
MIKSKRNIFKNIMYFCASTVEEKKTMTDSKKKWGITHGTSRNMHKRKINVRIYSDSKPARLKRQ